MGFQMLLLVVLLTVLVGVLAAVVVMLLFKRKAQTPVQQVTNVSVHSSIVQMREMGQLLVFRAVTKEVVTVDEKDHKIGLLEQDFKALLITEYYIDFRYDLRKARFEMLPETADAYRIVLPPCNVEVTLHKSPEIYHSEMTTRLWIQGVGEGKHSNLMPAEQLNALMKLADEKAKTQTRDAIYKHMIGDAEKSARTTLRSICSAFDINAVEFEFDEGRATVTEAPPSEAVEATAG